MEVAVGKSNGDSCQRDGQRSRVGSAQCGKPTISKKLRLHADPLSRYPMDFGYLYHPDSRLVTDYPRHLGQISLGPELSARFPVHNNFSSSDGRFCSLNLRLTKSPAVVTGKLLCGGTGTVVSLWDVGHDAADTLSWCSTMTNQHVSTAPFLNEILDAKFLSPRMYLRATTEQRLQSGAENHQHSIPSPALAYHRTVFGEASKAVRMVEC
jgi:hypothetical protein